MSPGASAPGRTVVWHLSMFAVALALPILAFVGFLLLQYATVEQDRLKRESAAVSRSIAQSIDRELNGLIGALDVLATSRNLQTGDMADFYEQAKSFQQRQGSNVVLRDLAGQTLVNTRVPYGAPLPVRTMPIDAVALDSGKTQVSGVFFGAVAKQPLFTVLVPVSVDGKVAYLLNLALETERLNKIIQEDGQHPGTIIGVVDQYGRIMARSQSPDEYVGKEASADFLQKATGQSGLWRGRNIRGESVVGAYTRTRTGDWRVAVAVEERRLNAPIRRSIGIFAGLGLGLAALSTAFALFFARRISKPLRRLADSATALGQGLPVEPLSGPLSEANQVGRELSAAATRLRQREIELHESNDEIQRFAYIASHDLRAPLVNIMGFTSELETLRADLLEPSAEPAKRTETKELFDESLGFIKAAIGKMDALIGAILRISRESRRSFRFERLDTTGLVQQLVDSSLRFQADAVGAVVEVKTLPPIVSDTMAFQQIFANLLDNAVKYLDPERPGRISVSASEGEERVFFLVRDNGRGIAEKDLGRVFELFRRAGAQDKDGQGIGLAHVRTLVRALGGRIDVTSRLGVGTTFTVILPLTGRSLSGGD